MKTKREEEKSTLHPAIPTITGRGRPTEVHIDNLREAPWNPRAEITAEDVAELAQSIRENGLLNRLSVVKDLESGESDGVYIVFAGNRRLAACREAGVKHVPVEVFDISLAQAKVLTALENLQRKNVEPIREAGLVEDCLDAGMTGEEIAAKIGKSNAWVTRRRKLLALPPKVREAAERFPNNITADALENIAIRPLAAQSLDTKIARIIENQVGRVDWSGIESYFKSEERILEQSMWFKHPCGGLKEECMRCPNRTGAQPDLFGETKEGEAGRCLDRKCYENTQNAFKQAFIAENVPEGCELVEYPSIYMMHREGLNETRDAEHPCAYVAFDHYGNDVEIRWGKSKAEEEERQRIAREAEDAKNREARLRAAKVEDIYQAANGYLCVVRELGELLRPLFSKKVDEQAFRRLCEWLSCAINDCYSTRDFYVLLRDVPQLRASMSKENWAVLESQYAGTSDTRDEIDWEERWEPSEDDE